MATFSYATFFMFVCVAIMAATAPSAANISYQLNVNGALICNATGTPAAPNVTVSVLCGYQSIGGIVVVLDARTSATGTIVASTRIGPLTRLALLLGLCTFVAPPQICPGSLPVNTTLGASLSVSTSTPNSVTATPTSTVGALARIAGPL